MIRRGNIFTRQWLPRGLIAQGMGGAYNQVMRVLAYWSVVNSGILLIMGWETSIGLTIRGWFPWLTLPTFLVGVVIFVAFIMAIDFWLILPAVIAFANRQQTRHDNPIYNELKAFRDETRTQQAKMQRTIDTLVAQNKNG